MPMTLFRIILSVAAAAPVAATALGLWVQSRDTAQASHVWRALEARREAAPPRYDPAMVAGLPEVAQRYFARAIEPGTPLHRMVRLEMEGSFILNGNDMAMHARQFLAPPARGFVWRADIGAGLIRFGGSDGYHRPESASGRDADSWTRFWLHGVIPLARTGGTEHHARAAGTRLLLEPVWAPASLLPQFGAEWTQTGPDSAEIRFAEAAGLAPMQITPDSAGNLQHVWAMRWTDANPEQVWQLQPFGGRMLQMARHEGFLIPAQVELGNICGTHDYARFFRATITRAEF